MDVVQPSIADSSSRGLVRRSRAGMQQLVAPLRVDLSACKYELLRLVAARLGWQVVPAGSADSQWDLFWTDTSISQERLLRLAPTQRINHFHGMLELCRKRSMARLLAALAAAAPPGCAYDFFPATWQLPGQLGDFLAAARAGGRKATFIVKPDAGCQGKGIKLVQGGSEAAVLRNLAGMATLQAVAQAYIPQPLLIHGLKFDLRVYVLVADVDPLRVLIYKEGLVRFCTAPYCKPTSKNLVCTYMHLTNYAVNKHNAEAFVAPGSNDSSTSCAADSSSGDEAEGDQAPAKQQRRAGAAADGGQSASKWSFSQLRQHLESQGHSWSGLWSSISQLVVKSLAAAAPHLAATYRTTVVSNGSSAAASRPGAAAPGSSSCSSPRGGSSAPAAASSAAVAAGCCPCFEVLGYDVLLDAALKLWLVEVNHSPSFNIDSPLDRSIKEALIIDAVRLLRIEPGSIAAAKQAARKATQARLVAPPPARGSSSRAAGSPVDFGCSADVKAAQQAHRETIVAARDKWQDRHLGSFERIYPVPMPGLASSSKAAAAAATTTSPAKLAELEQLQQTYDQLLAVSQQLYSQHRQHQAQQLRQQQQQSVAKSPVRSLTRLADGQQQPCGRVKLQSHQQVPPAQLISITDNTSQQQQRQQQQQVDHGVLQPARTSLSEDDEHARSQPCNGTGQQVSVESALALLTAALARPDVPPQHCKCPASAGSSQQIRAARSLARPQSARAPCSSSSRGIAATRLQCAELCNLNLQHTAMQNFAQGGSMLHTFRSNTSSTSASSSGSSRSAVCMHGQRSSGCGSTAAPHQVGARPRPASAPRLRGCSGDHSSNTNSSSRSGTASIGELVRPWSSKSSRQGRHDANSNEADRATPSSAAVACFSRECSASLQQLYAVTAKGDSSRHSNIGRRRSNSCSRVRRAGAADLNAAVDSMQCSRQNNNTGATQLASPLMVVASAATIAAVQQHSRDSSMSLIAAAVQEATAALDAAVIATCSSATTPRPAALPVGGLAAAAVDCNAGQQIHSSGPQEVSARIKAAHECSKGPLQSTVHSSLSGPAYQWQQHQWHPRQQQQQQCSMADGALAGRPACLARFSSLQGGRDHGSRQLSPTLSKAALLDTSSGSQYINSLLQQHHASRACATPVQPAPAPATAAGSRCVAQSGSCQQRQVVQRSISKGTTASSLHAHSKGQHTASGRDKVPVLQPSGSTHHAADGLAGAVVLGSSIRAGGQCPLLRHCSTGGLLGRLRLVEGPNNAAS